MKHMINACAIDLDVLPCGILKVDGNRNVVFGNQYALNLLNYNFVDAILGLSIEELMSFATRIFLDSYVYPILLNEGAANEIQLSLKSSTGQKLPIVANIQINPDKTTYWTFMSCVNRDQLYTELLSARDTLEAQTRSLAQINAQIEERQSGLEAFCHSLSHDFTGPLQRIRQLIEFAVEDLQGASVEAPDVFEGLVSAQRSSDTLIEMIKGLVEYLVADAAVVRDEVIDMGEIVSTILAMRDQQDAKAPLVHWSSLPSLRGSKAQMQVLFKNLIENAIKYNKNDPKIYISHIEDVVNNRVVIAVKDNGIGMPDAHVNSIFNPFTRLNTTSEYSGSGLGLSIVRKMVLNHGGDITVESVLGEGSTFHVSLPLNASFKNDQP